MIRILFVSTSTTLGGAEKTLYTLATLLDPAKFKVVGIVSLKAPGTYAEKLAAAGFKTYSLGLTRRPAWKDFRRVAEIIRETGPDIIHAQMFQAMQMVRILRRSGRAGRAKIVSSPRVNYRTRSKWTLLLDRLLKGVDDLLIAESQTSRDYLIKAGGYPASKVKTIYNGVDISGWSPSKLERHQKRLEHRLGAADLLVGAVGRLDEQKGHHALIEAFAKLKSQPIRCAILGEGPRRRELEERVHKFHLEKQVWLLGERRDMTSWLSAFDIFVMPSLWEGLPNALLEAMALGLPVVASNVDGIAEVIRDGQNGLLVAPNKPSELAQRILELTRDPAARGRLGAAAKETIADKFTLVDMISAYEAAYQSILA